MLSSISFVHPLCLQSGLEDPLDVVVVYGLALVLCQPHVVLDLFIHFVHEQQEF